MNRVRLFLIFCVISGASWVHAEAEKSDEARLQKTNRFNANKAEPAEKDLYLESTIVGDKEQPTVSYFIPWKGVGTPDQLHWNIEQKNDGTLDLIDRNVLIRSMSIYNELGLEEIPVAE